MEKYLLPVKSCPEKPTTVKRNRWKRGLIELNGRFEPNYRHHYSGLIFESYSEVGLFSHKYHVDGEPCPTHIAWFTGSVLNNNSVAISWKGVSSLEFDSKGVYLASVTKSGCLTVHDFDSIQSSGLKEDEGKQLLHISTGQQLDVIRWNLSNQDEVACTSIKSSEVCIFDIGYISSEPVQIVYGASKQGTIYMWDLRGGRSSSAFGNQKEGYFSPLIAVKLAHELEKISSLKAQSNIVSKEIHSIDIDPSCPYQLAFHLDDDWSGVLDTNKLQVTHIHCPPPSWLDECNGLANLSHLRKPCWLPMNSIYVVGSSSSNGLYLLDFYPHHTSPCHVDYNDDIQKSDDATSQQLIQNRFLTTSEGVTACAAHPLNGTIVAGTTLSSLLLISQSKTSC